MKFILFSLAALAALAEAAPGVAGTKFGLLTLRSASPVHFSQPAISGGRLVINFGDVDFIGVWTSEGYAKIDDGSGLYLSVDETSQALVASSKPTVFDIDGRLFATAGSTDFGAVLNEGNNTYNIYTGKATTTGTSLGISFIVLQDSPTSSDGAETSTASATSLAASSSTPVVTSVPAASSTLVATTTTVHSTASAAATPSANSTSGVSQVNGAPATGSVLGGAVAAAAVALGGALFL